MTEHERKLHTTRNRKYRATPKGKAATARANRKSHASPAGIARKPADDRAYRISEKGKATQQRGQARYRAKYPERYACNTIFNNAIAAGKIIRPTTCSACPEANGVIEGHHADYSKPLAVEWVCGDCHRRVA